MARELEMLSQTALAGRLQPPVTPAAISQYERGAATPSADIQRQLATRLRVGPDFFGVEESEFDVPAYFRSLRSAPAAELKRARHNVQLVHRVARELASEVKLPKLALPRLTITEDAGNEQVEEAAANVRSAWSVPRGPIDNVVRLLERHGVVVARLESGHEKIDAFSVAFSGMPVVMMSAAKGKKDRARFDVSHELGHLVMHTPGQRATKVAERQAQQFASAFLMPRDEICEELPRTTNWEQLFALKRRWQVSLAALLYRARSLRVMPEDTYVQAMKALSARGWRRHEPVDLGEPESPVLLHRAIELGGLGLEELVVRTGLPVDMLRDILDLAGDDRPEVVI